MHDQKISGERAMKHQKNKQLSSYLLGMVIGAGIALPININAAPGVLSDSPLFLTNKAEPNIFFMTDDSGSMDWEITVDGTGTMDPTSGEWRYVFDAADNAYGNTYNAPAQENDNATTTGVWRARNHLYNKMYYNPATTYTPWPGVDNAGVAFKEAYINSGPTWNTRQDPYLSASTTVDLSTNMTTTADQDNGTTITNNTFYPARYWVWDDTYTAGGSDNDDVIDAADSHTLIEIFPDGNGANKTPVCTNGVDATVTEQRTEACKLRTYADEMANFANWYTYNRRREYAAKNAIADVVKNSGNVRMGLATLNSNQGSSSEEAMASMNNDMTSGNKKDLADAIYSIQSDNGTPLRRALQDAGNYYAGDGGTPFGDDALALDTTIPANATTAPDQCSQNFTVLMTDGFYGGSDADDPDVDNADADNSGWTGDYDPANNGTTVTQTFRFDEDPYQDTESDSLADVAMHYYERDLRTSTPNKVPIKCGVDENPGQHMVTYTVAFGVKGTLDTSTIPAHPSRGYATNCTATTGSAFTWPDPDDGDPEKIDDLVHAAYNGRGEYLNATNPKELSTSLTDAFKSITSRIGAGSGVTFNTNSLNSESKLYQAKFNSTQWSGELEAYSLDAFANVASTPDWQAATVLDARTLVSDPRTIITYNDTTDAAVAFDWANLSSSQQNDLKTDSTGTAEVTIGFPKAKAVLDYIRGDRDCEIGSSGTCSLTKEFRTRNSRLGDLIHSQPIYSGAPKQQWPEQAPFGVAPENYGDYTSGIAAASAAFSSGKNASTRTSMIYSGANDGMLHAFNAETGEEVFAYIPSTVYSTAVGKGLHTLSEPSYTHKYYVDLSPTLSQAYIDTGSGDNWHSVLLGGLRGGGRGLYALNVTDPDSIIDAASATAKETAAKNMVMWEFTNADDADLGYSFSRPSVVPVGTDSGVDWYVVFGNGYNADTTAGADGKAYLFVLKLEGPGDNDTWDLGTDYYKVPTGVGATNNLNGLSTPAVVDLNRDSIVDRVYAGDLHGNMWAFNLTGAPANNNAGWASAYTSGSTPAPLFYATDGDAGAGNKQPITTRPTIIRHPTVDTVSSGGSVNEPNLMVYFGTGQYLTSSDLTSSSTQSFYAVWDQGDDELTVNRSDFDADPDTVDTDADNNLVKKTFTTPTTLSRVGGTDAVDYTNSTVYGWYYDLPETAERVTTNSTVRGDVVFFNTLVPSLEPCGYGGSGWELGVQTKDGSSQCGTFDTNGDGIVDCATDDSSAGTKKIGSVPNESSFISGGGGGTPTTPDDDDNDNDDYNDPNASTPPGTLLYGGPGSCPEQTMPAPISCPSTQKPVFNTHTDTDSCKTFDWSCEAICTPPKKPVTKVTNNSDGTLTSTVVCVEENISHTGRFSWRELPFN